MSNLKENYLLEEPVLFSESMIWDLQRKYFTGVGIEAWRRGQVPHYITSNPFIAKSYAAMVLAYFQDREQMGLKDEMTYILEMGAGSGRFAFHFLKELEDLEELTGYKAPPMCYILSDIAESNLEFWKQHPRFQPYIQSGKVDFALFDAVQDDTVHLVQTGITLEPGICPAPLIAIGNYFFDSIPQDLFLFKDGKVQCAQLGMATSEDPEGLGLDRLLEVLMLNYQFQDVEFPYYGEDSLDLVMQSYLDQGVEGHVLFPHTGLRCLQNLRNIFPAGVLLLSADKGDHLLDFVQWSEPPFLVSHGSFSLNVNYHALAEYCRNSHGKALTPQQVHFHLNVQCMLFLDSPDHYPSLQNAYEQHVNTFGADDFFGIMQTLIDAQEGLSFQRLTSGLRLSSYDPQLFGRLMSRISNLVPSLAQRERISLIQTIARVWERFYPLGESWDLAFDLGMLLYQLGHFEQALVHFGISEKIYGQSVGSLYNSALCYERIGQTEEARILGRRAIELDPQNDQALNLMKRLSLFS